MSNERPFLILIVLDGFGCRKDTDWNAIAAADKPRFQKLFHNSAWTTLEASGLAVGLPPGQMGNSEVGHLNMGAGRVVYQDLTRITKAVDDGDFFTNPVLKQAFATARERRSTFHLMGLVSNGGVHSDMG